MSLLIHAALFALVLVIGHEKGQIAGPAGAPDQRGGGGGGGGSAGRSGAVTYYVTIAPPVGEPTIDALQIPEVPEAIPIEPLSVDVPPPTMMQPPAPAMPDLALGGGGEGTGEGTGIGSGTGPGSGSGTGGGSGSGTGTGTGSGSGAGSGEGGTIRPPNPMAMLIPPMPPSNVRGVVRIGLMVDATGRVTEVQLLTPTRNSRYNRELERTAAGWRFHPARDENNRAVAYPYEYEYEF